MLRALLKTTTLAALVAAPALVAPADAHAQADTCVVLRSPSHQAPEAVRESLERAVAEEVRRHGNVVLTARDAALRMIGHPASECASIDCAAEVNRHLGTSIAVLPEVMWAGGRPTLVNVALIGSEDGDSVGGQAEVVGGDIAAATRLAFTAAWDRWAASQQGYLVVTTDPPGAFIEVDGLSLGRAPVRRLVRSGTHVLRASLDGHRSVTREITVDRRAEREVAITLHAGEGEDVTAAAPRPLPVVEPAPVTRDEAHWANYAIGGGLLAVGALVLVPPIWTAATEGELVDDGRAYVSFGAQSGVLLGVGIAAIIGGVVVTAVQPIRTTVIVSPTTAGVAVQGEF